MQKSKAPNKTTRSSEGRCLLKKCLMGSTLLEMDGLLTSMIGLCQEGKSSPDAPGGARVQTLRVFQRVVLASRPRFLFEDRTRLPLVGAALLAAHKIEFVFSCQSRNLSTGASGAYLPSLSRLNG